MQNEQIFTKELNKLRSKADDIYNDYFEPFPNCLSQIRELAGQIMDTVNNDEAVNLSIKILKQLSEIEFYMDFHNVVLELSIYPFDKNYLNSKCLDIEDIRFLNAQGLDICENLYNCVLETGFDYKYKPFGKLVKIYREQQASRGTEM